MVKPRSRRSDTNAGPFAQPATLSSSWRLIGRRSMTASARKWRGLSVPTNSALFAELGFGLPVGSGEVISSYPQQAAQVSHRPRKAAIDTHGAQRAILMTGPTSQGLRAAIQVVGSGCSFHCRAGHRFQCRELCSGLLFHVDPFGAVEHGNPFLSHFGR